MTIYISLFGLPIIDLTLLGGDVLNISAGGVAECERERHQDAPATARITSARGSRIFTTRDDACAFISSLAAMICSFVDPAAASVAVRAERQRRVLGTFQHP